jgi:hypothetical protein
MPRQLKIASNLRLKNTLSSQVTNHHAKHRKYFLYSQVSKEQSTNFYHCKKASVESVQVVSYVISNNECDKDAPVLSKH